MMNSFKKKEISQLKNKKESKFHLGKDKINLESSRMSEDQVENVLESIDLFIIDIKVDLGMSIIKDIYRACTEGIIMKCCN